MTKILDNLKSLIQTSNLASKKWISQQYDSQVMNDTIQTGGDAAVVRIHGTKKAIATCVDCTPRYVEADPFEGAKQAVAETYRNISAVGAKPLAITNCLNFGNPQKPEIMGQIVRAIKGITQASKDLNYPVVSGNVSLYNETDGAAIQPTPAIGGVGLLKDLDKRCDIKFKREGDEIFVIGKTKGHLSCSIYEAEILKTPSKTNPPAVDLLEEKKHGEFVRNLIENYEIDACHDVSDGGLLVTVFEMSSHKLGCRLDLNEIRQATNLDNDNAIMFAEDQGRYVVTMDKNLSKDFCKKAAKQGIEIVKIGEVAKEKISLNDEIISVKELITLNEMVFEKKFS